MHAQLTAQCVVIAIRPLCGTRGARGTASVRYLSNLISSAVQYRMYIIASQWEMSSNHVSLLPRCVVTHNNGSCKVEPAY